MNTVRLTAIGLIVAGILGLVYGGFDYTTQTHHATLGALELAVTDRHSVAVPAWAGAGAILIGGMLLEPISKSRKWFIESKIRACYA
jgi:TRAP-type C4-dicarboxylate transport system permease small subunit